MSGKKKKAGRVAPLKPQPEPTHFAVPIVLYGAVLKVLEDQPYNKVNAVMAALQQCQPLAIPVGARPGATVPGLGRDENES